MVAQVIQPTKPVPKRWFTPIGSMVAIHVFPVTETAGGITLPDDAVDRWETPIAEVVAVGPDVKQVKAGQRVLSHPSTMAMKVRARDGRTVLLVDEKHLAGVLDDDN